MPIVRTSAIGAVCRYIAGDAVHPFIAAEWTPQTDVVVSVDAGAHTLILKRDDPLLDSGHRWVRPTVAPQGATQFVQAQIGSGQLTKVKTIGLGPYWDGQPFVLNNFSADTFRVLVNGALQGGAAQCDAQAYHPYGGVTTTLINEVGSPARFAQTWYRLSVFVDGVNLTGYAFDSGFTATAALVGLVTGYPGLNSTHDTTDPTSGGDTFMSVFDFLVARGRYVRVTAMPTGWSAKVLKDDATVLATAAEAGGVADVDMLAVKWTDAATVAVYNGGGVLQDQLTAPGADGRIFAGETYRFIRGGGLLIGVLGNLTRQIPVLG